MVVESVRADTPESYAWVASLLSTASITIAWSDARTALLYASVDRCSSHICPRGRRSVILPPEVSHHAFQKSLFIYCR